MLLAQYALRVGSQGGLYIDECIPQGEGIARAAVFVRVFVVVNLPRRQPRDVFKGDAWIVSLTRVVSGLYSWDAHLLDLSEPQAGN